MQVGYLLGAHLGVVGYLWSLGEGEVNVGVVILVILVILFSI